MYVADVKYNPDNLNSLYYLSGNVYNRYGELKHRIQLRNIPQKGFACFYGDEKGNSLITYNNKGEQQVEEKDYRGRTWIFNVNIKHRCLPSFEAKSGRHS